MAIIRTVFGVLVVIAAIRSIWDHGLNHIFLFFLVFGLEQALNMLLR
jgi:hypothetical protein